MTELPPKTHNQPPIEAIKERTDDLIAAADVWLDKVPEIASEEQAGKAADFVGQLRAEYKATEAERKKEKQPHLDAGKAVDDAYKPVTARLEKAAKVIKALLTGWLEKKQAIEDAARRDAEEMARQIQAEADRLAREAEKANTIDAGIAAEQAQERAAAAQKDAGRDRRANVQGETGRTIHTRTTYSGEIADWDAALAFYSTDPLVSEAVGKAIARDIRGGTRVIPGVKITQKQTAA